MVTTMTPVPDQRGGAIVVALADQQRAAVQPHHDREIAATAASWSEDVQVQAVFRRAGHAEGRRRLRAVRGEAGGLAHAGPGRGGPRRLPAQRAHRRGRVRDAEVFVGTSRQLALDPAVGRVHDRAGAVTLSEGGRPKR